MSAEQRVAVAPVLPDWLARRTAVSGNRLALLTGKVRWTFADLDREATRLARRLAAAGVQPGEHVATLLGNGPIPVALLHALPRLGAVLVPLNLRLTPAELAFQVRDAGARLLLHDAAHAERAEAVASEAAESAPQAAFDTVNPAAVSSATTTSQVGSAEGSSPTGASDAPQRPCARGASAALTVLAVEGPAPAGGLALADLPERHAALREHVDLAAVHSIVYTSGTTGRPKGALLTYGNHWWNAVGSALNLGLLPDDRLLASLPLFHVGGMAILWRSVLYGAAAVVHARFDADAMNAAIDQDGVTIVSVVAAMLQRMLDARGDRPYPPTLRCVLLGGGPAPRPLLEACAARGVPVVQTYGLTETASQAVTLAPEDALRKLGSAGKPLFPVELRVERDGASAPPGVTGEIMVLGPSVSPGYHGGADSGRPGGWLRTGDLGWLDEDGYLYVADRRDDLIISGGENVYPAEVEAALLAHPSVAEAGVVGRADARWGQVPEAIVSLRPGAAATEAELLAFCADRLARYKVPVRVRFLGALPRTASGKLLRRALREA